ncbi:class I SAM-dependent methyltransferase [Psychroflexus aestuariivivens]|uniref:class I SAM-dependent methyltransferase n=1 Tax=Psychroflexus aestuariivivens TaxID=1795040 RepID=UPI000FD80092|nr:class I SAM-dependent methyltransferase [Psychroflexus aestuariivivens]
MSEFWNERFSQNEYVYGEMPNAFFAEQLDQIKPVGKLLLPLEGEGRNAVFAAKQGWFVDAFDASTEGRKKARLLASQQNVKINYDIAAAENYLAKSNTYDAVALIYSHLNQNIRTQFHHEIIKSLKTGGTLIVEAFHPNQLLDNYTSGGPKSLDMLYTPELLEQDFAGLDILNSRTEKIMLSEGEHHQGEAFVTRFVAKKL